MNDLPWVNFCCRLLLASSTVTDLVDRMERLNYVRRVRDENDRRVIRLEILDEGRDIIKKVMQDWMEFLSARLNEWDKEKLRCLLRFSQSFVSYLRKNKEKRKSTLMKCACCNTTLQIASISIWINNYSIIQRVN